MSAQNGQKTQAQIKAEKRAAALRDNLKKRKAQSQSKESKNDKS
ncbi:MAG: hypothetical protein R3D88_06955 [Alphaproteobacteria bacterium]|jgi:hypothetical protein|nr:hypothetical protein [Alphaproteobacteria bacterium]